MVSTMGDISVRCGVYPDEAASRRKNAAVEFDKQCGTCDASAGHFPVSAPSAVMSVKRSELYHPVQGISD